MKIDNRQNSIWNALKLTFLFFWGITIPVTFAFLYIWSDGEGHNIFEKGFFFANAIYSGVILCFFVGLKTPSYFRISLMTLDKGIEKGEKRIGEFRRVRNELKALAKDEGLVED